MCSQVLLCPFPLILGWIFTLAAHVLMRVIFNYLAQTVSDIT